MALTRAFKDAAVARARRDPAFRRGLLGEAVAALAAGDAAVAKGLLRDLVNATLGFAELAGRTGTPPKSLMRTLGGRGNPRLDNLAAILAAVAAAERVEVVVTTREAGAPGGCPGGPRGGGLTRGRGSGKP